MAEADDRPGDPYRPGRPDEAPEPNGCSGPDPVELRVARAHAEWAGPAGRGEDRGNASTRAPRRGNLTGRRPAAVLTALDRTRAELAAHADQVVRDAPTMPPAVLAALDRSLAAERAADRRGPRRPGRRRVLVLAGAAVVAVLVGLVLGLGTGPGGAPSTVVATPAPGAPDPTSSGGEASAGRDVPVLGRDGAGIALRAGLGHTDYGPLADPDRRAGCLDAHGVPPGTAPVGAREVVFDGRPAVALVFTTGVAARFRVLVVEAGCTADRPLTLADTLVGR